MSSKDPQPVEIDGKPLLCVCRSIAFGMPALYVSGMGLGIYGTDRIQTGADRFLVCAAAIVLAALTMMSLAKALVLRGTVVSISADGFRDKRISTHVEALAHTLLGQIAEDMKASSPRQP